MSFEQMSHRTESLYEKETPPNHTPEDAGDRIFHTIEGFPDLQVRLFTPETSSHPSEAIIYIAGNLTSVEDSAVAFTCTHYMNVSHTAVYTLSLPNAYSIAEQSAVYEKWLAQECANKGITSLSIIGHSLGGYKAMELAKHIQDHGTCSISGLLLLCPAGLTDRDSGDMITGTTVQAQTDMAYSMYDMMLSPAKAFEHFNDTLDLQRNILNDDFGLHNTRMINEMTTQSSSMQYLSMPVGIVFAQQDTIIPPIPHAEDLFTRSACAQVLVVPGGHSAPVKEDTVLQQSFAFLQDITRSVHSRTYH